MSTRGWENALNLLTVAFLTGLVVFFARECLRGACGEPDGRPDAVVLVKSGVATAQWNYQQLPMKACRWCGRTVNLNRHHAVPQAANPALRDVKENLIVLCRDCHFVLGHRCDWKRYNPDVLYIATHFTNCVRSADTRYAVTNGTPVAAEPAIDPNWKNTVTNRESLDEAIGRLFDGHQGQHTD